MGIISNHILLISILEKFNFAYNNLLTRYIFKSFVTEENTQMK